MATSTTASSTNINTARSAGEGNELLDLRDTDASEQDSSSDDNGGSPDDPAPSGHDLAAQGKDGLSEALKAERRRTNHLEKELRGVRQQLTRFSEINPEEYSRLQEAERQKQLLEQQLELRERQMEEAAAKRGLHSAAGRAASAGITGRNPLLDRHVGEQGAAALPVTSHLGWAVGLFWRRNGFQQTLRAHALGLESRAPAADWQPGSAPARGARSATGS